MSTNVSKLLLMFALAIVIFGIQSGCWQNEEPGVMFHGPHGGHSLNSSSPTDYLMEFTVDQSRRKIIIYTYQKLDDSPFPIPVKRLNAEFKSSGKTYPDLTFVANPRPSDPQGSSSRFSLDLSALPQQLMTASRFSIKVSYALGDVTISGSMEHNNNHAHNYDHD